MELPRPENPPSFQRAQSQRSIADQEEEAIRRIEAGRPPVLAARQLTNRYARIQTVGKYQSCMV